MTIYFPRQTHEVTLATEIHYEFKNASCSPMKLRESDNESDFPRDVTWHVMSQIRMMTWKDQKSHIRDADHSWWLLTPWQGALIVHEKFKRCSPSFHQEMLLWLKLKVHIYTIYSVSKWFISSAHSESLNYCNSHATNVVQFQWLSPLTSFDVDISHHERRPESMFLTPKVVRSQCLTPQTSFGINLIPLRSWFMISLGNLH